MNVAVQLPCEAEVFFPLIAVLILRIISRAMAPESRRIIVKLAASIVSSFNASRHKTELAANAISAQVVKNRVFAAEILVDSILYPISRYRVTHF